MKAPETIITIKQLAEMHGYPDIKKVTDEASKAGILLDIAGTPHVYLEEWNKNIHKKAASQRSSRKKSGKSLADTDQLGIINSNLKRLPESIRSKERKLKTNKALLKSASSDYERNILRTEIGKLDDELFTHKENLKKAQKRQKEIHLQRTAELDAREAESEDVDDSTAAGKEAASE